jgi:hypothetical protein
VLGDNLTCVLRAINVVTCWCTTCVPLPGCTAAAVAVGGVNLGKGIIALPQKLGGGVSLTDLETGKSLASLWYSNYGAPDPNPPTPGEYQSMRV